MFLTVLVVSCYSPPTIRGFDPSLWEMALEECNDYRMEASRQYFTGSQSSILTLNQNELQELLGNAKHHELFSRNQKFFYYQLDCDNTQRLSVRFDALGRVKEVNIEKVSK
jgi:hypothetical protein